VYTVDRQCTDKLQINLSVKSFAYKWESGEIPYIPILHCDFLKEMYNYFICQNSNNLNREN